LQNVLSKRGNSPEPNSVVYDESALQRDTIQEVNDEASRRIVLYAYRDVFACHAFFTKWSLTSNAVSV